MWLLPALAAAESSVCVLGLRALDGDDETAREISRALRESAGKIPGFSVSDQEVSLAQMGLAHGCEDVDARCMADIAATLGVSRLLFGTTATSGSMIEVTLFNFDSVSGQLERKLREKISAQLLEGVTLGPTVDSLMRRLAGLKVVGTLRVLGNRPRAPVVIDGVVVGMLDVDGELVLPEISAGPHRVVVESGEASEERRVEVAEGLTATVRVAFSEDVPTVPRAGFDDEFAPKPVVEKEAPKRRPRRIVAWTLVGVGGAFALGSAYSWIRLGSINKSEDFQTYREQFPRPDMQGGVTDVCDEAARGTLSMRGGDVALENRAYGLCRELRVHNVLQWVLPGAALTFTGVGAYLLLTDKKDDPKPRVHFTPSLAPGFAHLSTTVRF